MKYKCVPVRLIVAMFMADKYNKVMCMDLKKNLHTKTWILNIIDPARRFSVARLEFSKEEIMQNIYLMWISYFGEPRKFLCNNGG